jgi:hypothetical protein
MNQLKETIMKLQTFITKQLIWISRSLQKNLIKSETNLLIM